MKKLLFFATINFIGSYASAQTPNWAQHIAPILYPKCTNCHNPNGIAPFSLITYGDALDNSSDIQQDVNVRKMPPWTPDPGYCHLANERTLTQHEIKAINDWVNGGAPQGDLAFAPTAPVYDSKVEITSPDLASRIPSYSVNTSTDLYRCFVIPTGLNTDQFITEMEAVPGNRSIVHHILIYEDASGYPAQLDAADPEPGYTNFGGTGSSSSNLIGIWSPGQGVYRLPAGTGIKLRANTNIVLQIHYPGGTHGIIDSTKILFKLSSSSLREVYIAPALNHDHLTNGQLIIPANTTRTFYAQFQVPITMSMLAVGPHMHLIGKSILSYGVTPEQDTIPFINIPSWDFHWQGLYSFRKVLKIPQGTMIYSTAFYDNTSANPENPNNPPKDVQMGEATTDEMMLVFFSFMFYQPGDENIVIDTSAISYDDSSFSGSIMSPQLYQPNPNPVRNDVTFDFYLPDKSSPLSFSIYDVGGRLVTTLPANNNYVEGLNRKNFSVANLAGGNYLLQMNAGSFSRTKKFVKE